MIRLNREPISQENSVALSLAQRTPLPEHNITQHVVCEGGGKPPKNISLRKPTGGSIMHKGTIVTTDDPLIIGVCTQYECDTGWVAPISTSEVIWKRVTY